MSMIYLEILSFDPSLLYSILSTILVGVSGLAFVFNMKNQIQLLKNDLKNTNENVNKLEQKNLSDFSKIECKMQLLEEKIEELPVNITNLIKTFLK